MDRQQAIAKARYLRCGATVLDMETGTAQEYHGKIPHHYVNRVKVVVDGEDTIVKKYRTKFTDGPSIGAAKRAMRALKGVVAAKDKTETTRFYVLYRARQAALAKEVQHA